VLRFLTDPRVPFIHNLAEQGACDFAVIRSLIATAEKQGWNVIHTLTQSPTLLIAQLRTA